MVVVKSLGAGFACVFGFLAAGAATVPLPRRVTLASCPVTVGLIGAGANCCAFRTLALQQMQQKTTLEMKIGYILAPF